MNLCSPNGELNKLENNETMSGQKVSTARRPGCPGERYILRQTRVSESNGGGLGYLCEPEDLRILSSLKVDHKNDRSMSEQAVPAVGGLGDSKRVPDRHGQCILGQAIVNNYDGEADHKGVQTGETEPRTVPVKESLELMGGPQDQSCSGNLTEPGDLCVLRNTYGPRERSVGQRDSDCEFGRVVPDASRPGDPLRVPGGWDTSYQAVNNHTERIIEHRDIQAVALEPAMPGGNGQVKDSNGSIRDVPVAPDEAEKIEGQCLKQGNGTLYGIQGEL